MLMKYLNSSSCISSSQDTQVDGGYHVGQCSRKTIPSNKLSDSLTFHSFEVPLKEVMLSHLDLGFLVCTVTLGLIVCWSPWSPPWGIPASTLFCSHSQTDPCKIWIRHHHFSAQSLSAAPIRVLLWLIRPKAPPGLASANISGGTSCYSLPHSFSHSLVATPWACQAHSCSKAVAFASPLLPGTLSPASSGD